MLMLFPGKLITLKHGHIGNYNLFLLSIGDFFIKLHGKIVHIIHAVVSHKKFMMRICTKFYILCWRAG